MVDKTTTALTAGTAPGVGDLFYGVQGGNSRKWTGQQVLNMGGTSFPGSPATGDRFYRTDRNIDYFYDGAQWLSTQIFTINGGEPATVAATAAGDYASVPFRGVYSIYILSINSVLRLSGASGNWTLTIDWRPANNTVNTIHTHNITTATTWEDATTAVNAVLDATARVIGVLLTENSGAVGVLSGYNIQYRLVG